MSIKKNFDTYGLLAFLFAIGSIVAYALFSDAKLIPFFTQFKIFAFLSIITLLLLIAGIISSIAGRVNNIYNSLILVVASILVVFNLNISYQTIFSYFEPSELEVARNERFETIKLLKASDVKKISVSRYLQIHDFKNIESEVAKEGKILVRDIKNKESILEFINILQKCSFEKWPRYKAKGDSFYIALYSNDNSKMEFNVSHIKATENTYEIFSYNSEDPIYKKNHGAGYSDEIHKWIKAIN